MPRVRWRARLAALSLLAVAFHAVPVAASATGDRTLAGTVEIPAGVSSTQFRVEVYRPPLGGTIPYVAGEVLAPGGAFSFDELDPAEEITVPIVDIASGSFEVREARPGSLYCLRFAPLPHGIGYYRAGARGLVAEEFATPYRGGEPVEVRLSPTLVTPNVLSLAAPLVSGSSVVGSTLSVSSGTWDPATATATAPPPRRAPRRSPRCRAESRRASRTSPWASAPRSRSP